MSGCSLALTSGLLHFYLAFVPCPALGLCPCLVLLVQALRRVSLSLASTWHATNTETLLQKWQRPEDSLPETWNYVAGISVKEMLRYSGPPQLL